jgi:hypothetical protein
MEKMERLRTEVTEEEIAETQRLLQEQREKPGRKKAEDTEAAQEAPVS